MQVLNVGACHPQSVGLQSGNELLLRKGLGQQVGNLKLISQLSPLPVEVPETQLSQLTRWPCLPCRV